MTEYELDRICDQNPNCGGNCAECAVFAHWINSNR